MRLIALILCSVVPLASAPGTEVPVVREEIHIPIGKSRSFEFGTLPQRNTTVLLDVFARLDSKSYGGSMYFMKIVLNGRVVKSAKTRTVRRLQNRPTISPVAPGLPYSWFGQDAWRVLYAPDFEGGLKKSFYVGNPYQLVLDVTDLTNPAAENRLEMTNVATSKTKRYASTDADLVVQKLTIRTQPGASSTMAVSAGADEDVINRGTPGAGPAKYRGELMPGGGFVLSLGEKQFLFSSAISFPNAGLNRLIPETAPDMTGQKEWKVIVRKKSNGGEVAAEGPDYRVQRTVRYSRRKVEIVDRITNKRPARKLGLFVRNEVGLEGLDARVRLAGNPDPAVNEYYSNGNPSVYVRSGDLGLGLLCEDDVFRNQATLFFDPKQVSAGLRTEMLLLPPGGSYTLEWSVYPVASGDYYDFINLVREDWGSNYTVEGAWCFFSPDTILAAPIESIRERFRRLGIRRTIYCGGWVDRKHDRKKIGFGTGVEDPYWTDFRDRLRRAAVRIRQAVPECKVLIYYDTQRDTSDGGHERFKDSWLTNAEGKQLSTEWSGVYSLTWSVVASLHNSFGKAMLGVADRYFDELGADGLYWDEMETTGYGAPLITYAIPDGHSCILDKKTYTIDHEIGITTLLGKGHRLAVIDRVRARGGTLMGNGPTTNKAILAKHPQRMIEIQHNDTWSYEGNLDTPLGYASGRMDFGNWTRAIRLASLLVGTSYHYEHEISRYVLPFTPIELHSGYLLGKERIITIHSGKYGWPGERCLLQVHHFDKQGKHTGKSFATAIGKEARTQVVLNEGEAAILERLPIVLKGRAGKAEVRGVRYSADEIAMEIKAPAGVTVNVRSRRFKVEPRMIFEVQVGQTSQTSRAGRHGLLSFAVKCQTPIEVTVRPAKTR